MLDSLLRILPVFLIIAFGVLLDIRRVLPKQTGSVIGSYALYVALPALLLHILAGSTPDRLLHGGFWVGLLGTQVVLYVGVFSTEMAFSRRGQGPAAVIALASSCSNVAFIGLPVVLSLMPNNPEALVAAGLGVFIPNLIVIPCQIHLDILRNAEGGGHTSLGTLLRSVFLNPMMLATATGMALGLSELGLPGPVDGAAQMLGNTAAPCMLLALGLDLRDKVYTALHGERRLNLIRLSGASMVKLVINPLLAWLFLSLAGVTGTWLAVGVIMSGTATALLTYVIADIYNHTPEEVAMVAVVTNSLNLLSLTALTELLRWQGLLP